MFGFSKMFGIGKKAVEEKRLKELERLQRERQAITDHIAIIQQLQDVKAPVVKAPVVIQKVQGPACIASALKLDLTLDHSEAQRERTYSELRELDIAARKRREEAERQDKIKAENIARSRREEIERQAQIREFARQSQLREEAELRYREEERMIRRASYSDINQPQPAMELAGEIAVAAVVAYEVAELLTPKPEPVYVEPEPVYVEPEPVYVRPEPVYSPPEPSYSSSRDDSSSYDSSNDSSSSDD